MNISESLSLAKTFPPSLYAISIYLFKILNRFFFYFYFYFYFFLPPL